VGQVINLRADFPTGTASASLFFYYFFNLQNGIKSRSKPTPLN
jgi:hypothetical protein